MFCASGLVFGGTEGVETRFHVLLARACFRWNRGFGSRFHVFSFPDSFSTLRRLSGPIFMFCARTHFRRYRGHQAPVFMFCDPGHVFGGTEGVGSQFHVLHFQTHFRRYRGRRFPFSCFALPYSFSAVPRASGPVFMFCAPGLIFGGTKGFRFRFHVLRSRTCFRRCQVRRILFSCFVRPNSFLMVPRASGLIFGGPEGVGSRFLFLRSQTNFRRYGGRWVPFSCLRSRARFRRFEGRRFLISCFALTDSFSAVPRTSVPVLMFCAPGFVLGGTEDVESRFHVLRARTRFRRYRGRRVPFSWFALPDSFSAVLSASDPDFMFCAT
jgi:hypothetical protein